MRKWQQTCKGPDRQVGKGHTVCLARFRRERARTAIDDDMSGSDWNVERKHSFDEPLQRGKLKKMNDEERATTMTHTLRLDNWKGNTGCHTSSWGVAQRGEVRKKQPKTCRLRLEHGQGNTV